MGIKGKLLALVMALVLMLAVAASAGAVVSYEVQLPSGHNTSGTKYPVVYLMPQDGYTPNAEDKELAKLLANEGLDMVVVMPKFTADMDLHAEMAELVAAVDADTSLHTIANAKQRAVVGIGNGGYLAYVLGMMASDGNALTNPGKFAAVASIRGNFADSATNPWLKKYGSVYSKLSNNKASFKNFYTYMDAPVDDAWTNMSGSTNDLGYLFIDAGTTADNHEYTSRLGEYNKAFMKESAKRITDRLTKWMVNISYTFNTSLTSAVVTSSDDYAEIPFTTSGLPAAWGGQFDRFLNTGSYTMPIEITISAHDPETDQQLTVSDPLKLDLPIGYLNTSGTIKVKNVANGQTLPLKMNIKALGTTFEVATGNMVYLKDTVVNGDYQLLDLMGDWHFKFTKSALNVDNLLSSKDYESWSIVQPALAWWASGFGNVTNGSASGNAYYVREFVLPDGFDTQNPVISVGYVDDCCQVYINGKLVGSTGFLDNGEVNSDPNSVTWDVYSYFDVDPTILKHNGEVNTIVVRDYNKSGGGGWYAGPISLYSKKAFDEQNGGGNGFTDRFYEESYYSEAIGAEMDYLVYLPKDYNKNGDNRFYPTMYLMHQFQSTHMSYMGDGIYDLMEEAIKEGLLDEMIVVIPNSEGNSWWKNEWEDMVVEDLIPHIEAKYRTIPDARYRMTAGCSMGGQGALSIALRNPDVFSGTAGFYGAYDFGDGMGSISPITLAKNEGAEYMDYFTMAFICGNQDDWRFGRGNIRLNQTLENYDIDHYFFIENGAHNAEFYVPYFQDTIAYVRSNMFENTSGSAASLINVEYVASSDELVATFTADEAIRKYFNVIPDSKFTKDTNPGVTIPVIATIKYEVKPGALAFLYATALAETKEAQVKFNVTFDDDNLIVTENVSLKDVVPAGATIHNVQFHTQLLGRDHVSDSEKVEELKVYGGTNLPSTGDNSNIMLFGTLLTVSVVGMTIMGKKKASC